MKTPSNGQGFYRRTDKETGVAPRWAPLAVAGTPTARADHTAVRTNSEMIIWGGSDGQRLFDTGGAYDPVSETWLATVVLGAPSATINHTAVWSGTEMIIWNSSTRGGGRYRP